MKLARNVLLYLLATALVLAVAFSAWLASFSVLALLSAACVIVLALLGYRARAESVRSRQIEATLREREEHLRSVLAASPDVIVVMSAAGDLRHIFSADPDMMVNPTENLVGQNIHTRLPADVADKMQDVIDRTIKTRRTQTLEYPLTIGGHDKWFAARVVPFGSPEDPCVLWVARDMTEHRRAEEQRLESELRFSQLAENMDEVIGFAPRVGPGVEYISPAYETIWGRSCQSLYDDPRSWMEAIHPDDRQRVTRAFEAESSSGTYEEEFRIVRDDGTVRWVRDRSFLIRDQEGKILRVASLTQDITERKLAEQAIRQREEQLSSIIDTASEAVIVADSEGLITLWNKASEEIFGYEAQEAVGQPISLIVPRRFRDAHTAGLRPWQDRKASGVGGTLDLIGLHKDGREFPAEMSFTSWGTQGFITGIVRDVTERKQAEDALRESEQRFRSAFEDTRVGMVLADPEGHFTRVNRAFCEMLGYSEKELVTMTFKEITHPDDLAESTAHIQKLGDGTESYFTVEKRYVRRDGAVVWAITSVAPVLDAAGRPKYLVAETQNITERKRAEEKLRDSEERFRSIFEHAGAGMHTAAPDGRYLQVNEAFCKFLGYTREELTQLTVADVTHAEDLPTIEAQFTEVQNGQRKVCDLVKRYVRKDGAVVWGHVTAVWLPASDDRPAYGVAMIQDVTEQRRAGEALLEAKEDLERRVVERTADLVATNEKLTAEIAERKLAENIQRSHTRVLEELAGGRSLEEVLTVLVEGVEGVYQEMLGVILLIDGDGKHLQLVAAPSLPESCCEIFKGLPVGPDGGCCGAAAKSAERVIVDDLFAATEYHGCTDLAEAINVRACWSQPILSSVNEVLGIFTIFYREPRSPDEPVLEFITSAAHLAGIAIERRRAEARLAESEEQLRVSDRLASLGTLVAGLGHDMNNVLFPVRCRLDAVDWDNLPEDAREAAKTARDSVEYLQQLSSGLRLFAADPQDTQSTLDVTSLPTWWGQVQPLISKMIPNDVTIHASIPDDLPLLTVAPHRLSQAVLNLVTNAAEAMPAGGTVHLEVRANSRKREVAITVSDEGVGMSEEVRRRALDPFFTTKKRSLSTGLGLSLVLGVVRRAHGSITIDSAPGKGTSIRLVFPTAQAARASRRHPDGTADRAAVTLSDLRTAAWVTHVLESAGYSVSLAEDGDPRECDIWITEPQRKYLSTARDFLTDHAQRRIIVLGSAGTAWTELGALVVEDSSNLDAIKTAVYEVRPVLS